MIREFKEFWSNACGALRRKKLHLRALRQEKDVVEAERGVRSNILALGLHPTRVIRAARAPDPLAKPPAEEPEY